MSTVTVQNGSVTPTIKLAFDLAAVVAIAVAVCATILAF